MTEPNDPSTYDLLIAAQNGDADALGHMTERVRKALLILGRGRIPKRLRGRFETADVVDSVITNALPELRTFRYQGKGSLLRWFTASFLNRLRSKVREHEAQKRDARREESLSTLDALASALQSGDSLDDVARAEGYALLVFAFSDLTAEQQRVIACHFDGMSWEEIGKRLGVSGHTASRRFAEAFGELQKKVRRKPPGSD